MRRDVQGVQGGDEEEREAAEAGEVVAGGAAGCL